MSTVVVATSAEPTASNTGTGDIRYSFSHRVPTLDLSGDWAVSVAIASFYAAANSVVFINASIVQGSRIGAQLSNEILHIPDTGAVGTVVIEPQTLLHRPASVTSLDYIEISLTDQNGVILPVAPPGAVDTYVTLVFTRS